jgi:hypothetical protein
MIASMSHRGNCYDNAPMESFCGLLKNELVHHRKFKTRAEAIEAITEYIENFTGGNVRRRDWAIYHQPLLNANTTKTCW